MDASIWISLSALIVSILTLIYTIYNGASQSRLKETEERADLLTRLVELKLEYEQEVNHLYWLADIAHRFKLKEANKITRMVVVYKEYVSETQEHYDNLLAMQSPSKSTLLDIGHHIDALRVRVKSETEKLHIIKEQMQALISSSQDENA